MLPGHVYVVATPIGNLDDITLRAANTLHHVDVIASEDTRHTLKLLNHLGVASKPRIAHHDHNLESAVPKLLAMAERGLSIAVVSDAGTPSVSDPGAELVARCIAAGVTVVPIPGACAAVTALSACGFIGTEFRFVGFLPRTGKTRRVKLAELIADEHAVVFYESPHRILSTLEDLAAAGAAARSIVCARELTKIHEALERGTVSEVAAAFAARVERGESLRGEFTAVLGPLAAEELRARYAEERDGALATARGELEARIRGGESVSSAARIVAKATGIPRGSLYRVALEIQELEAAEEPPPG